MFVLYRVVSCRVVSYRIVLHGMLCYFIAPHCDCIAFRCVCCLRGFVAGPWRWQTREAERHPATAQKQRPPGGERTEPNPVEPNPIEPAAFLFVVVACRPFCCCPVGTTEGGVAARAEDNAADGVADDEISSSGRDVSCTLLLVVLVLVVSMLLLLMMMM